MAEEHHPTPPHLVEVVSADSVDDVMADMANELATLQEELDQVEFRAAALERRVCEAGRASDAEEIAGPLVRHVLEAQMAETRASMAAALDEAVREADVRVTRARAAAPALAADRAPGGKPAATTPMQDVAPVIDIPTAPPAGPALRAVVQPPHEDPSPAMEADLTTMLPAMAAEDPPPIELIENASAAFGDFWVDEGTQPPRRDATTGLIDIVLPLVALLIIVIVVLSWIG